MHIGVLTHNYPRFPGDFSGTFIKALCDELVAQKQQITIFAPYDPAYTDSPLPPPPLPPPPLPTPPLPPPHLSLYRYIWPDRYHRLGYMRSMQSDLALRLESYFLSPGMFAAGITHIVRQVKMYKRAGNPIDVLHAHWLLPNGFIAAVVSKLYNIPLVVSVPGSDAQVARANPLFRAMARFALNQADLLTANSADLRDAVVEIGADEAKFDLILYGVDPNELRPDAAGVIERREKLINSTQMNADERSSLVGRTQDSMESSNHQGTRRRNSCVIPSPPHPLPPSPFHPTLRWAHGLQEGV